MDFWKAWEMMKLQQEAMKIKKELENTLIETVNGEMKIEKVEFESDKLTPWLSTDQQKIIANAILEATNKGIKKSQEVAAEQMKWVMSQMWMWDMMWGWSGWGWMWLPGM